MGAALLKPEVEPPPSVEPLPPRAVEFRFHSLVASEPSRIGGRRSATLGLSIAMHAVLIVAIVVVPLYLYEFLPETSDAALRAFFVAPPNVAPPPPPPP